MGAAKPPMQVTVDLITKGDAMGWSAVIEPYVYTLSARCIDDSKAIAFDGAKLREHASPSPWTRQGLYLAGPRL